MEPKERELFNKEVYEVVAQIPYGRVTTYGDIAWLLGRPNYSRLVGSSLKGATGLALPCHRVVNAQGRLVPGWSEQRLLLEQEGVNFCGNGCVDLKTNRWRYEELK
ncbi:MAG: methylated-DNA--[protein]-cysteine S-methyltransferase [Bacteroides sp.]|nr:methylated-DNA--[protein]-cysteine S-methyltransferase [Bacteroides sp.]